MEELTFINYFRRTLIVLGIIIVGFMAYAALNYTPGIRSDY